MLIFTRTIAYFLFTMPFESSNLSGAGPAFRDRTFENWPRILWCPLVSVRSIALEGVQTGWLISYFRCLARKHIYIYTHTYKYTTTTTSTTTTTTTPPSSDVTPCRTSPPTPAFRTRLARDAWRNTTSHLTAARSTSNVGRERCPALNFEHWFTLQSWTLALNTWKHSVHWSDSEMAIIELCYLYPCPCPSKFVEQICITK